MSAVPIPDGWADPSYDFDSLSQSQIDALCNVAFGGAGGGVNRRTLELLTKKGLIVPVERSNSDRLGRFTWTEYDMPLIVHIDFCAWCSQTA